MKALYTVLLCIAYCVTGLGQKVSGQLINSSNEPLPEAYIFINNSDNHVHSNSLGYFEIKKAAVGDTLGVTYMGYQEVAYVLSESDFENEIQITLKAEPIRLDQVYVDNSVKSVNRISKIDLEANPVQSSQEVLRKVPGLFIGQHAGGGKAEQIFLRGFDIDHGTDISISVDGLPVNMVSHAHGQGYSDLHFLIPEVIRGVDFAKGPYYAEHGNFTTAGYVDFHTLDRLGESSVGLEIGRFNTLRTKAMFDVIDQKDRNAYIASEFISSDGPFESSQNFNRMNIMGKFTTRYENNDQLALTISRFQSKWDASGQIPVRAVESGLISRFGAIDDTEGGQTSRSNILIEHTKEISPSSFVKSRAYYSHYDFELFSNFTFFLKDEENGDQIRQFEDRNIYGLNTTFFKNLALASGNLEIQLGGGFRYDDVNDNELAHTVNRRTTIEQLALGDVDETNIDLFANVEFEIGRWMINPGLRLDAFKFDYVDRLKPEYTSLSETKSFLSPKLNIIYNPNRNWQLYLKSGRGFHSNDTRVVVAREGEDILPAAYGMDVGSVWKPVPDLWINLAAWYLYLEQEFVYVGDAGIVEPSGRTERYGIDAGIRYQLVSGLYFDSDLTWTRARSIEGEEGENYIPLAPEWTAAGGMSWKSENGLNAGLRYRFLGDRPANEDYSIVAFGYFILDANAGYTFGNGLTIGFSAENLLNTEWEEAQFATESRLLTEDEPVEEIHFTPGTPFFIRGLLRYSF